MNKNEKKNQKILKKMNSEKIKAEKKANPKTPKERRKDFLIKVKEFCIKDTSRMILLVAILFAIYIVINLWARSQNLAQIDLTKSKLYTLTDQSKNIAKTIDNEMTFYVWGFSESTEPITLSNITDLLNQYNKENSKIKYEVVSADDVEKIQSFDFDTGYAEIRGVSADGKTSYISKGDLYTYDANFKIVNLTEQKLTNAIVNLSNIDSTKVYFIEGKTAFTTESGLYALTNYLESEHYYEVETINIMSVEAIPEDCDVLAIMGLSSDFTPEEANLICQYIEKGGDILITNDINFDEKNITYPNFQKILDEYYITMPNKELNESAEYRIAKYSDYALTNIASDHEITRRLFNSAQFPVLLASGIIEQDSEKMLANNVKSTPLLISSTNATLLDIASNETISNDGVPYVLGVALQKTVESGDESRAVIFASTTSFSDTSLDNGQSILIDSNQYANANIILNSFAFISNRGELYSIRKSSQYTTYTPTEQQDKLVRLLIYMIPVAIAILGICVWLNRRKLK